jgi:hypothetical protein
VDTTFLDSGAHALPLLMLGVGRLAQLAPASGVVGGDPPMRAPRKLIRGYKFGFPHRAPLMLSNLIILS